MGGTFFRITLDGGETVLYSFGAKGSGATPQGLTLLSDGNYYGTTASGGANNLGTVYKMTPAGEQTVLYSFAAAADGQTPVAGLSNDSDGNLYGVTYYGGTDNFGTIFRIAPDGSGYATVHSFAGGATDGQYPGMKLRNVADGSLYGSTGSGGADGLGTIFRYEPSLVLPPLSILFRVLPMMAETLPAGFAWEMTEIYTGLLLTVVTLTWAPSSASLQRGC